MKTKWIIFIILIVFLLGWIITAETREAQTDAPDALPVSSKPLPTVRYIESEHTDHAAALTLSAITLPNRQSTLKAELTAKVESIIKQKGETAKKNEIIIQLDDADWPEQLKAAEALLKQRELEFKGAENLKKRNLISDAEFAVNETRLSEARARVSLAQQSLKQSAIRAPYSGVIDEQLVEIGDHVQNGDPLFTMLELEPLLASGYVTERQRKFLSIGMDCTVQLLSGQTFPATISYISQQASFPSRTLTIEAEFSPAADENVSTQITADIIVPLKQVGVTQLSAALLSLNDQGRMGVKALDNNTVIFVPIEILSAQKDALYAIGIPEKTRIITAGHGFVTIGEQVSSTLDGYHATD